MLHIQTSLFGKLSGHLAGSFAIRTATLPRRLGNGRCFYCRLPETFGGENGALSGSSCDQSQSLATTIIAATCIAVVSRTDS